jgi:hypothetical protein
LVGETIGRTIELKEKEEFDASEFRVKNLRVDIYFDREVKHWFCGWVAEVHPVQVTICFANKDKSVRMKPLLGQIRRCFHEPQLLVGCD